MKKKTLFFFVVLIMIGTASVAFGQEFDAGTIKTWGGIGQTNKTQTDGYYFDICPFGPSDNSVFLGIYGGNLYSQFSQVGITNGRITSWFGGLSINSMTENYLFFKFHVGVKNSITRYEKFFKDYNDYQEDFSGEFLGKFGFYNPEASFFGRTMFTFEGSQPITTKKRLYYDDQFVTINDSLAYNSQFMSVGVTQTIYKFPIDKENDWFLNFDLSIGYVFEHEILNINKNSSYFTVGGGVSIFGSDCYYQNTVEVSVLYETGGLFKGRPYVKIGFDVVGIVFGLFGENCDE